MWKCRCECGNVIIARAENLHSGNTQSCGCYKSDLHRERMYKHGMSGSRLAHIFSAMKDRCYNKNNYEYDIYGGRGIAICDEWLSDSKSFYEWAINNGYSEELSIDRIDNNKGYSPNNCRWADWYTQANNVRSNIRLTCRGETHTLSEWSRIANIDYHRLYNRYVNGWSAEEAIFGKKRINQYK